MYRLEFVYDNREDAEAGYVFANLVQNKKILKDIVVRNMMTGTVLYDYSFDYFEPGNYYSDVKSMYCRLKSIGLIANGLKLNPTVISWNKNSHYPDKFLSYPLDQNMFNKMPFTGDFNGDGFSDVILVPYKVGNSYTADVQANMCLNKGDGTFESNPSFTFNFDKTLEWVYIVDFDGDGLDDVVPYYANYENGSNWKSKICVYLNRMNTFTYIGEYSCNRYFTIYPGDFFGDRKAGFFLEHNNEGYSSIYYPHLVYYNDNALVTQTLGVQSYTYHPERVFVDDINGDGCSEIVYMMENSSVIAKITRNANNLEFFHLYANENIDSDDFLFPGDFNGDGYLDLLIYDNRNYWRIALSDGNRLTTPVSCLNNTLLNGLTLAPQDRYLCSLQNLPMPSVTIRTADFDGDGKTDVGVFKNTGGNYYLEIGFKMREEFNNNYGFTDIRRFQLNINHSHQFIHLGNFLGHENVSIIGSVKNNPGSYEIPKIVALNPHSSKFSVERITDGLGSAHGFKYEYLMPGKENAFYEYDYQWINDDVRTVAIPARALAADTVFSDNGKPCVTRRLYKNAWYHTKGHGLLGFQRSESKLVIDNTFFEKTVLENELETLADNCIAIPKSCSKYNFSNQLVAFEQYFYTKYQCASNNNIIMPMISVKKVLDYDCDASGAILKSEIYNLDYQSDMRNSTYADVVNLVSSSVGVDANYSGDDAEACQYWEKTDYTYDNNINDWVIARVQSVKHQKNYDDNESVGTSEIYEYLGSNPYQITKLTSLPNAGFNYSDPLKITTDYSYDAVGHMVMQSLTTPSSKNQRIKRVNYGEQYNYRYPTTQINENGWEVDVLYDNDYGTITSTLDYNQFEMDAASDPLGITVENVMPDGVKTVKAKRWADGNKHSPPNATYYVWEKTTGRAETMSFFNINGKNLRDVTFGLNGEAIYVDYYYDEYGNIASKSMPYKAGDEAGHFHYVYDKNNRLIEEIYPNGLVKNYSYNGHQTTINTVSPEGITHNVVESYNPLGWRMQTVDIGGNAIDYEYYSDGKLKSAMIGNDPRTKVEYEYDNRRNMLKMNDPSLGEVLYEYDAFGELKQTTNAKNCVTSYDYDNIGNPIWRTESDENGLNIVATQWVYDNAKGKIGTLSRIIYGDKHEISYNYDDLLRITEIEKTIDGNKYSTMYTYDAANRDDVVTYPSGVTVKKMYSNSGYYKALVNLDDEKLLWRTDNANAMGDITDYQVGNGLVTSREYDAHTGLLTAINTQSKGKNYQKLKYSYDGFGNLLSRTDFNGTKKSETFVYDNFNRLQEIRMNDRITGLMEYDDYGNIISKYIDNQDVFYEAHYDDGCPYAVSKIKTDADNIAGAYQNIEYAAFDKIANISDVNNSLSISYGYDYDKIKSVETIYGVVKEKVYVSDCEFVNDGGRQTVYTFLKGPMGVFAICLTDENGDNEILYVHKDHLESWCLITDEDGNVVQRTSYDAWGNPRNDKTWSGAYNGELLCDRGFTGHEHLSSFGLIDMKGRAYDPMLSMMMSPDNYIQNPDFSQNYNRYSYCYNNPLSFSDPSGEWVEWLLYGMFNGAVNLLCNRNDIDSFTEGLLSFGAGFVSGCLSQGLSECSWVVQVVGGVAGSTLKSGVNSFVKQNTGPDLDWNLLKTSTFKDDIMYALGSSIAKSVLGAYLVQPTDSDDGKTIGSMLCKEKVNQRLLETASKKIVGNIFAGRKMFAGFGITKDNWEEAMPYVECLADIVSDNLEFETSSETLSVLSNKILNFDFSGVARKVGSDANYCYSQIRSLFRKN